MKVEVEVELTMLTMSSPIVEPRIRFGAKTIYIHVSKTAMPCSIRTQYILPYSVESHGVFIA